MANLRGKMKKLQTAIVKKGIVVKINHHQFYSEEQCRMLTSYSIIMPMSRYNKKSGEWKDADCEMLRTCSMVDVIQYLLDVYKAVSG